MNTTKVKVWSAVDTQQGAYLSSASQSLASVAQGTGKVTEMTNLGHRLLESTTSTFFFLCHVCYLCSPSPLLLTCHPSPVHATSGKVYIFGQEEFHWSNKHRSHIGMSWKINDIGTPSGDRSMEQNSKSRNRSKNIWKSPYDKGCISNQWGKCLIKLKQPGSYLEKIKVGPVS